MLLARYTVTADTVRFLFRSTITGQIRGTIGGFSFQVDADTGVDDGCAAVEVSGLAPGWHYFWSAAIQGDWASGHVELLPEPGTPAVLAWFSCASSNSPLAGVRELLKAHAIVSLGDSPYCNNSGTAYGETAAVPVAGDGAAIWYPHYRKRWRNSGLKQLLANRAVFDQIDDHDIGGGDDWDHTITQANDGAEPISAVTQADVDGYWSAGGAARDAYLGANPTNSDSEAGNEAPSEAAASAANYPPRYYRFTIGDAEVFVLDCVSHRDPIADPDTAAKTMLGSKQKAWIKARLAASTATFKLICSPKKTYALAIDNGDGWSVYSTERDEILDDIASNSITGVVWLTGDRHTPQIIASSLDAGESYDHVDVCACPIGVDYNATASVAAAPVRARFLTGVPVFGRAYIEAEQLALEIVDVLGNVLWRGTVAAGTNYLASAARRVAA